MMTGPALERRIAEGLHAELDRVTGPHPDWVASPAADRVAAGQARVGHPGRLLAAAFVVLLAGGVALALGLGLRRDETAGCPTLADYAAASAVPMPSLGEAPLVSFPAVGPDATPTTGDLQPGTWAVMTDARGPVVEMRLRDVHDCGRLPDARSGWRGGSLLVATADVRVLRDDADLVWLGAAGTFDMWPGGDDAGRGLGPPLSWPLPFGIPGVDRRTSGPGLPSGFSNTSLVVFDVPATDLHVGAYPRSLSFSRPDQVAPSGVGWILRAGRSGEFSTDDPTPGATPTTGELAPGDQATVTTPDGDLVVEIGDLDQVSAYPGLTPASGSVFVEARLTMNDAGAGSGSGASHWRAVDGDGRELRILPATDPASPRPGVLGLLAPTTIPDLSFQGWLVVEAPPSGLIRLELTRNDDPVPTLAYVIRRP